MWDGLSSRVWPLTAKSQNDLDAVVLYNDPTVNSAKMQYPHIAKKIKGESAGICENAYERIARLGVLQGTRRYAQVGDALTHLAVRANCYLRPCNFLDDKFDDPYELLAGDEENDIPPDQPEDNETEDGPFTVRDKLNQLFPDGVHCVFIGKTYAEAWSESMDDGLVIGFPYEGDGDGGAKRSWMGFVRKANDQSIIHRLRPRLSVSLADKDAVNAIREKLIQLVSNRERAVFSFSLSSGWSGGMSFSSSPAKSS